MASNEELVLEFREMVDRVIQHQVDKCNGANGGLRHSWPGYDKEAKTAGLQFVSVGPRDSRPSTFGLGSEHLWGVSPTSEYRVGRRTGRVALISTIEVPDKLHRRWQFEGAMEMTGAVASKDLVAQDDISAVLAWVRSPHLEVSAFSQITALSDEELKPVDEELRRIGESHDRLVEDLKALSRAHRISPEDWNRPIG
ncbi:MAG TPA: hypothetical protein VLG25_02560 [Patescibacteria group bacterium]|nr:hypothetical protein [Patescibacteria group bacterium]